MPIFSRAASSIDDGTDPFGASVLEEFSPYDVTESWLKIQVGLKKGKEVGSQE
jgi:hypothetical protein